MIDTQSAKISKCKISLRTKLFIPVIVLFIAFVLVLFLVLNGKNSSQNSLEVANQLENTTQKVLELKMMISDFYHQPEFQQDDVDKINEAMTEIKQAYGVNDPELATAIDDIRTDMEKIVAAKSKNKEILREVAASIETSVKMSNNYIEQVAQKLADPDLEKEVTKLERMVIIGANINTTSNLRVKDLFSQMVYDIDKKTEFFDYLKVSLENCRKDVERLADTPFAQLPVESEKAILVIHQYAADYVNNAVSMQAANSNIQTIVTDKIDGYKRENQVVQKNTANIVARSYIQIGGPLLACGLVIGIITWIVTSNIYKVLRPVIASLEDISTGEGDLTKRIDVKSNDEIGQLAGFFNTFIEKLHKMISHVADNAKNLAASAEGLSNTSNTMTINIKGVSEKSDSVANATEAMSSSMNNISSTTEQLSANVKTVAAAVEEMTASISEVARNAEQAASVANDAAGLAESSNQNISKLGQAADEIGKVVEVIEKIAEQTNLLALNATIEAARAGDAGKGFAVVATEVKELAKQTAEATQDIANRIGAIQSTSTDAVVSMRQIGDVISKVNGVSRTIASAVEEQSITTKEIAENVAQAATASETVAAGVTQTASASREIAKNISEVNSAAQDNAQGATQTQEAGQKLSMLARELQSLVGQFKI